jgi:haloalkane dehalogenase
MLMASDDNKLFSGMILSNGLLPFPGIRIPLLFRIWRSFAQYSPVLPVGMIVNSGCNRRLSRKEKSGYNYPFNTRADKRSVRKMPGLLPVGRRSRDQEMLELAWTRLERWEKPLITLFSDGDPITRGGDKIIQEWIPGAADQEHKILRGGHFLQEDAPGEISKEIIRFVKRTV